MDPEEVQAKLWTTDTSSLVAPWSPSPQCFSWDKWRLYVYIFSLQFSENMFQLAKYIQHKTCLDENRRCFEHWQNFTASPGPPASYLVSPLYWWILWWKNSLLLPPKKARRIEGVGIQLWKQVLSWIWNMSCPVPQTVFWPNLYRVKDIDVVHDVPKHFFRQTYRYIDTI